MELAVAWAEQPTVGWTQWHLGSVAGWSPTESATPMLIGWAKVSGWVSSSNR